jgi:hypothetical protein
VDRRGCRFIALPGSIVHSVDLHRETHKREGGTLGDRRMKGVLVGYARDSASYEIFDPITERVYNRRYADVLCDDHATAR